MGMRLGICNRSRISIDRGSPKSSDPSKMFWSEQPCLGVLCHFTVKRVAKNHARCNPIWSHCIESNLRSHTHTSCDHDPWLLAARARSAQVSERRRAAAFKGDESREARACDSLYLAVRPSVPGFPLPACTALAAADGRARSGRTRREQSN